MCVTEARFILEQGGVCVGGLVGGGVREKSAAQTRSFLQEEECDGHFFRRKRRKSVMVISSGARV